MTTMRVDRPKRRRSPLLTFGCGCLITFAFLLVIVVIAGVLLLPQIIQRVTGLTPQGQTSAVFAQVTPQPTAVLQNPTQPPQVIIDLGQLGQQTLVNDNPQLYSFSLGTGSNGQPSATASFTELGLMQLCQQRSTVCTNDSTDPRFTNAHIDLRPGGAVVYVDTTLPELGNVPLPAGIVLRWDAPSHRAVFVGVDIGGMLYTSPPQSLASAISNVEQQMNDLIQQAALEAGGGRYTISDVIIDDTTLTLILR